LFCAKKRIRIKVPLGCPTDARGGIEKENLARLEQPREKTITQKVKGTKKMKGRNLGARDTAGAENEVVGGNTEVGKEGTPRAVKTGANAEAK